MKLNKKGFAVSTMLYGLLFSAVAVFYVIVSVVSNQEQVNDNLVNDLRDKLANNTVISQETDIKTTIDGFSSTIITIASLEEKVLNITLTNDLEEEILYKMYYEVIYGTGNIIVNSTSETKGNMNGLKTLTLTLRNQDTSYTTINIKTKGAYVGDVITLDENQKEFV